MLNIIKYYIFLNYFFGIYAFSNESNLTCQDTHPLSQAETIDRISIIFSYPPERGMLTPKSPGGAVQLIGNPQDKENSKVAADNLFGQKGQHSFFDDSMFKPLSSDIKLQNRKDMINEKNEFIKKIKEDAARSKNPKALFFSGHGVMCEDPQTKKRHWCVVLPMRNDYSKDGINSENGLNIIRNEPNTNEPIHNSNSPYLVTEEELINATGAKYLILDSCHSNQATQYIQTQERLKSTVVISASVSYFPSLSSNKKGGRLLNALSNLKNLKSQPVACKIDIDGDGEVSLREIVFSMQINLLSRRNNALMDYDKINLTEIKNTPVEPGYTNNHEIDAMYSGNPSNMCVAVIPDTNQCRAQHPVNPSKNNSCENIIQKHQFFNQQINQLLTDKNTQNEIQQLFPDVIYDFQKYSDQKYKGIGTRNPKTGQIFKVPAETGTFRPGELVEETLEESGYKEGQYLFDKRFKEAMNHLDHWEDDLTQEKKQCQLSDESYCNVRNQRTHLFNKIKDLLQIVKYRKNKKSF